MCGYTPALMNRLPRSVGGAGGLFFMTALAVVGASNMGFHVVISRMLGPAAYGAFGSLLALLTLMTVPATGFQTLVTARTARAVRSGRPVDGTVVLGRAVTVGVLCATVMVAASPLIQQLLRLTSIWPVVWLALYALPLAALVVPYGLLCGQGRFTTVGIVAVASATCRIFVAVLFIKAGFGVAGAVAASVVADSLQAIVLYAFIRISARERSEAAALRLNARSAFGGVVAFSGLWLLTGVDTIAARQLFDPVSAGRYSAAATAVHAALYAAHALSLAALPAFASTDLQASRKALRLTLLASLVLTALASGVVSGVSPWLVPAVFGPRFQVPVGVIALMAVATTGIASLWILVQYSIAQFRRGMMAAWLGLPIAIVGTVLWHAQLWNVATVMIVAVAFPLAMSAWWFSPRYQAKTAARRGTTIGEPTVPVDLTVVVPFYNPGPALRSNLLRLVEELRSCELTFEVISVDDGSVDDSGATIADLDPAVVRRLTLPHNQGKGAAIRAGLAAGSGRYLGFIDADGDLDPAQWRSFVQLMRLYEPDAIIGDKLHPLTWIDSAASWTRNACSFGYRVLIRLLFPTLPIRDTQVGLKVFRRDVLADVLPRTVERRFVFDVEVLALASRMGYRRVLAAPISLYRVDRSTVTARAIIAMFFDTVRLAWRLQIVDGYRLTGLGAANVTEPDWMTRESVIVGGDAGSVFGRTGPIAGLPVPAPRRPVTDPQMESLVGTTPAPPTTGVV